MTWKLRTEASLQPDRTPGTSNAPGRSPTRSAASTPSSDRKLVSKRERVRLMRNGVASNSHLHIAVVRTKYF